VAHDHVPSADAATDTASGELVLAHEDTLDDTPTLAATDPGVEAELADDKY
jgi:hypothetical protein